MERGGGTYLVCYADGWRCVSGLLSGRRRRDLERGCEAALGEERDEADDLGWRELI